MNVPAILGVFRVVRDPSLCLPHATVNTFDQLPIPLSKAFSAYTRRDTGKLPDIKAVVLDKDNCFAMPHTNTVFPAYSVRLHGQLIPYVPYH